MVDPKALSDPGASDKDGRCSTCGATIDPRTALYSSDGELVCGDCSVADTDRDRTRTRLRNWSGSAMTASVVSLVINPALLISIVSVGVALRVLWRARSSETRQALGRKLTAVTRLAGVALVVAVGSTAWGAYQLSAAWQRGAESARVDAAVEGGLGQLQADAQKAGKSVAQVLEEGLEAGRLEGQNAPNVEACFHRSALRARDCGDDLACMLAQTTRLKGCVGSLADQEAACAWAKEDPKVNGHPWSLRYCGDKDTMACDTLLAVLVGICATDS